MNEFEPTLREVLAAGNTARFRASGDSMYPAIRSGDYLHIVPCDASKLRAGDIILASTERGLTAHRIVRIRDAEGRLRITMRGDNALRSDRPVAPEDVLGRVESVENGTTARQTPPESATIMRFATVLVRRLRSTFHQ
ncbi:MAG: ATP-binding cassette, subfamily bacterial [Thermoanaerobaculia bacterium]|nr:ATP-binding cassette, subfamily bacterial [Thermoanaerobaculia bacterium]